MAAYREFADGITKLYPRYYRYYVNADEGYNEDSATESDDGNYPDYTGKYRERDRRYINEFQTMFSNTFVMMVCNEETNCALKITWDGNLQEFFEDYLFALRGNRHVFIRLEYVEVRNGKPYFRAVFN